MATPDKIHFNALRATLEKTNRILMGDRKIRVHIGTEENYTSTIGGVPYPGCPSWTDGKNIHFNQDVLSMYRRSNKPGKKNRYDYHASILGLNYHELSHVLYTPPQDTWLGRRVMTRGLGNEYNILEDQRIESFFAARYSNAAKYFVLPILRHLYDASDRSMCHIVTYGRRYLPKRIRDLFEKSFIEHLESKFSQHDAKNFKEEIESVIDQYRTLPLSNNSKQQERALSLIEQFHQLMESIYGSQGSTKLSQDMGGNSSPHDSGCSNGTNRSQSSSSVEKGSNSKETAKLVEQQTEEQDKEEQEEDEEGEGEDSNQVEEGGGEQESDNSSGESQQDSENESEDTTSNSGSKGVSTDNHDANEGTTTEEDIENALQEVQESFENDSTISQEVDNIERTIRYRETSMLESEHGVGDKTFNVTSDMRSLSNRIEKQLKGLMDDVSPGWMYGESEGRINVSRYLQSEHGDDDYWDKWDEGREQDTGCEIYIGVDSSASMEDYSNYIHAQRTLWIIKRACDSINISTTVTEFGDPEKFRVVYGQNDRVSANQYNISYPYHSTTRPNEMIELASNVMDQSKKSVKLFIVITDGVWRANGGWEAPLRDMDAEKLLIGIGLDGNNVAGAYFDSEVNFNTRQDPSNMIDTLRATVLRAMNRAAGR